MCYGGMTVGLHNWGTTARDGDSDDARRRRLEVCPEGAMLTGWLAGSSNVEHLRKSSGSLAGRICSYGLKFADNIYYKRKSSQASKTRLHKAERPEADHQAVVVVQR